MPEGDAVYRTARRLETLGTGPLRHADLRVPAHATASLVGATTVEVATIGKHLLHRLDLRGERLTIHSHLRMDGHWLVFDRGAVPRSLQRAHTVRAVLATESRVAVGDELGMLDLLRTDEEHLVVGHLGPDILVDDFDLARALDNLMADPGRIVCEALLDQRNLAGIGTIYASDPLFLHHISPWAPVGQVGRERLAAVVTTARDLMRRNITVPIPTMTGETLPGSETWVLGRAGKPCRRCGNPLYGAVTSDTVMGRYVCYCPTCQGGVAPTQERSGKAPLGAYRRTI